jgi:predicted ATPase
VAATTNADAAVAVAREQDFRLMLGWALPIKGWASVDAGRFQEGMDQIENGLAEVRATGANQFLPYLISLKAHAHLMHGQPAAGLETIDEAFGIARTTGECFWEPELHRLRGELQLVANVSSAHREAEESFFQAIDIATNQDAKLLVLRSTVSLGRLLRQLNRDVEARQRVRTAHSKISGGAALPDVVEARAFLAGDALEDP